MKEFFLVQAQYDIVVISEAPDGETLASFFLGIFVVWAGMIYKQITYEYADYTTTIRETKD